MPQNGLSMFDYYISIGINPYSIGAIGFAGGGGALAANSVGTSNIIDGTIATVDIADGAITEAKFHPTLQGALTTFTQQLYNLESPGFWGNLKIKNHSSSDTGATMTITVQSEYYDAPSGNTDIIERLASTTIIKNHHVDIPITIDNRLTNKDTILRMYYTINKADIEVVSNDIVQEDDQGNDVNGNYYILIFNGSYAEMNGGNAEINFTVANSI
jgi:hypothetical protein